MELNGRAIDKASLSIDGVDTKDYPDFCDAYFEYATYMDGTELTDDELDALRDAYPEVANEMAYEHYL